MELSIALVIIGLIVSVSASSYVSAAKSGSNANADVRLAALSASVLAFVQARHRLPCPDSAGNGYEGLVNDACPAGLDVGWLPYLSLDLPQPASIERAIYGVYRNPKADLALAADLSTLTAASTQAISASYVYLTGDGTSTNGPEDCTGNVSSNPAFVILAPGEDRDGDGNRVDGINQTLPASGHCFSAPSRKVETNFDDRTIAVNLYAVMAKLNQ